MDSALVIERPTATQWTAINAPREPRARAANYSTTIRIGTSYIKMTGSAPAVVIKSNRLQKLNRYRMVSGAISAVWLFAAFAAMVSKLTAEPFFALFFSTFGIYLVFAIKCREENKLGRSL
jgi:hypothetical protein